MGRYAELSANVLEGAGIAAVLIGTLVSALLALQAFRRTDGAAAYRAFRQGVGRAILLGLEFLVGADILRTVSEIPSLEQLGVLAGIVALRTFLSFTLEVELEGTWPWRRRREDAQRT